MEEFGFFYALYGNPRVVDAVVRGISDFAQNKGVPEKRKSQEQASANARRLPLFPGFLTGDAGDSIEKLDLHLLRLRLVGRLKAASLNQM